MGTMPYESSDIMHMDALEANRPEAGKYTLMNLNTEKLVLRDPEG